MRQKQTLGFRREADFRLAVPLAVPIGMLLTMRANSIKPTVEPNPSVSVVTSLSEALGRVFCVEMLPKLCVMGPVEPGKSFRLHPLPDFRRCVSAPVDLLKQDSIDLLAFCGLRANKLYREVCARRPSPHLGNKRNPIREGRIGLLICVKSLMKGVHHSGDVRRQRGCSLQRQPLVGAEGDELQCNRQTVLKAIPIPEPALDSVVEVKAAGLELGAYLIIDTVCRAMLDFVTEFQKEL